MSKVFEDEQYCLDLILDEQYSVLTHYLIGKKGLKEAHGAMLLCAAIKKNDLNALYALLAHPDIDVMQEYEGLNALQYAALYNRSQCIIVILLLRDIALIDVNKQTTAGFYSIYIPTVVRNHTALALATHGEGPTIDNTHSFDAVVYALILMVPAINRDLKDSINRSACNYAKGASRALLVDDTIDATLVQLIRNQQQELEPDILRCREMQDKLRQLEVEHVPAHGF